MLPFLAVFQPYRNTFCFLNIPVSFLTPTLTLVLLSTSNFLSSSLLIDRSIQLCPHKCFLQPTYLSQDVVLSPSPSPLFNIFCCLQRSYVTVRKWSEIVCFLLICNCRGYYLSSLPFNLQSLLLCQARGRYSVFIY